MNCPKCQKKLTNGHCIPCEKVCDMWQIQMIKSVNIQTRMVEEYNHTFSSSKEWHDMWKSLTVPQVPKTNNTTD